MFFGALKKKTERLVCQCETITCVKCKITYTPTRQDISTKNPNVYWKNCEKCRKYIREANKRCLDKKTI